MNRVPRFLPGSHATIEITNNIIVTDSMQVHHHAFIGFFVSNNQNQLSARIDNHTDPVGSLPFKADVDGTRNMNPAEGGRIPSIQNKRATVNLIFYLLGTHVSGYRASIQKRRSVFVRIDNMGEALRPFRKALLHLFFESLKGEVQNGIIVFLKANR